ncbi:MAG TPA: hypothetical protein VF403_25205 [Kofleriaceae bacterium]
MTIAKELELEDADEDLGVKTILQAAERTGDAVGDGASTATLLAHAIDVEASRTWRRARSTIKLGALVADAVERVAAKGVVSLEEANGTETSLEVVERMSFGTSRTCNKRRAVELACDGKSTIAQFWLRWVAERSSFAIVGSTDRSRAGA